MPPCETRAGEEATECESQKTKGASVDTGAFGQTNGIAKNRFPRGQGNHLSSQSSLSSAHPKNKLLDKDWGAKIPDYITNSAIFLLMFIMGATIRGEWLLYLAFFWKWGEEANVSPEIVERVMDLNNTSTDNVVMDFMEQRFENFWPIFFMSSGVGFFFFLGIGGFLHLRYYVLMRDRPQEWKCQPNHWLPPHLELHEIMVGAFSLALGNLLSAALTCWVANGGYTTIYYEWGQYGYLWEFLSLPLIFLAQDYVTYWHHRIYHWPYFYKHFHKLHHTYKQPTAFSVTAIHPVEFLNIQWIYIAPMFCVPVHVVTYCSILIYIYTHGIIDHSGITFKHWWWNPWQPDAIFHDNHHQYFHVNFGFNVKWWDQIHGTERQKDKIYREDIFWGKGKDIGEATKDELAADIVERKDENPLAYQNNEYAYELTEEDIKKVS